jgi:hypothetical protein
LPPANPYRIKAVDASLLLFDSLKVQNAAKTANNTIAIGGFVGGFEGTKC